MTFEALRKNDAELADLLDREHTRQSRTIDLIASENHCPKSIREAVASLLTNKYAEGYPANRCYGGCEIVDEVERLAIERGKRLFACEHINVQPHSGSQANLAVYLACLKPGAKILAMDLLHGGHLTHGMKANFSGKLYNAVTYGVSRQTEQIDYDALARQAKKVRPDLLIAGGSSYPRALDCERLGEIAADCGTRLLVDMAHFAGLVAGGQHPDPIPVADFVTATTHKTMRGPRGGFVICKAAHARAVDRAIFPGIQGGPLMHVIAGKAAAFALAMTDEFKTYQAQVVANARAMAEQMASLGHRIVSGGTDTHLFLVDMTPLGMTGAQAEAMLGEAGIVLNHNVIPFDPLPPGKASGIRIGTPSVTSRGAAEDDVRRVARWIDRLLRSDDPARAAKAVREEVIGFCQSHPMPD